MAAREEREHDAKEGGCTRLICRVDANTSSSSLPEKGLDKNPFMPAAIHSSSFSSFVCPVMQMIGRITPFLRSSTATPMPDMSPSIFKSVQITDRPNSTSLSFLICTSLHMHSTASLPLLNVEKVGGAMLALPNLSFFTAVLTCLFSMEMLRGLSSTMKKCTSTTLSLTRCAALTSADLRTSAFSPPFFFLSVFPLFCSSPFSLSSPFSSTCFTPFTTSSTIAITLRKRRGVGRVK
mmetsp:Transcript_30817/g.80731  ORF Transcript_30817/g.80731 Transcript_30817/m.80731 type:complete len:236 (-) Transcript_30817:2868-3575(-)